MLKIEDILREDFDWENVEIDEDEFDDADTKVIDRLFYGKGCFIQQANKIIQKTEDKAEDIKYNITDRNISKTTMYNQEDIQVVSMLTLGKEVASVLGDYNWIQTTKKI